MANPVTAGCALRGPIPLQTDGIHQCATDRYHAFDPTAKSFMLNTWSAYWSDLLVIIVLLLKRFSPQTNKRSSVTLHPGYAERGSRLKTAIRHSSFVNKISALVSSRIKTLGLTQLRRSTTDGSNHHRCHCGGHHCMKCKFRHALTLTRNIKRNNKYWKARARIEQKIHFTHNGWSHGRLFAHIS